MKAEIITLSGNKSEQCYIRKFVVAKLIAQVSALETSGFITRQKEI